jgi:hypothetical protein
MKMTILLLGSMLATMFASGQQEAKPNTETKSQTGKERQTSDVTAGKPGELYDKNLEMHFNYPVEMRTLDFSAEMESGHQNIYGISGENDPEHQEAKRCIRPLRLRNKTMLIAACRIKVPSLGSSRTIGDWVALATGRLIKLRTTFRACLISTRANIRL